MDVPLVVTVAQAAGGLAGFIALTRQLLEDRRRRRWPPELRSVLLEVLELSTEAATSPQDRDWATNRLDPLGKRLEQLSHLVSSWKDRTLLDDVVLDTAGISATASDAYIPRTVEEASRRSMQQQEFAKGAQAATRSLLKKGP